MEPLGFAPRARLLDWFQDGWRLIPGYQGYSPSDWAILVYMPTYPKPVPVELMLEWVRRFDLPAKSAAIPNVVAAGRYAANCLNAAKRERKLAALARYEAAA